MPHNQLGIFYYHQHKFEAAEQAFAKIIELDPTGSVGYGNRGEAFLSTWAYDKALADLTQGLDRSPKDPYVNSSMARLLVAGPTQRCVIHKKQLLWPRMAWCRSTTS